ncbi:MAG: phenylalanine--tRNA ligase subunit alpha [Candidatus Eiseniibacteriota bacterium]
MTELLSNPGPPFPDGWDQGPDPEQLVPGQGERFAELEGIGGAHAAYYARAARGLSGAGTLDELQERLTQVLGRERGDLTLRLKDVGGLPLEERKSTGRALNLMKHWLGELAEARRTQLRAAAGSQVPLDITLPGRRPWVGRPHVLAQVRDELLDLFHGLGYSVYESREVETDEYNFGKLNFSPDHPARDAHDTYFVGPDRVMRTHTSPGWVRAMEERKPPLRLVFPGRVYRAEQVDASHMDQFHQIDGLCVGRNVSMADLKGTLNVFARSIYGAATRTRLIPIYFPFVEPGCQMDVSCAICGGNGRLAGTGQRCPVCKGSGWSELLGAGMVHPNVFRAVGYDPEEWTGFAFGMGVERIAMARYGIPEIRLFLENDVRFLAQF